MSRTVLLCRVDGNFGGVERYILSLAKGLDRQYYNPVIVGISNQGELLRQAREAGFDTEFLPMPSRLGVFKATRILTEIARNRQAELMHSFGLRSNMIAWRIRRAMRLPWIVRLPNINSTDYGNPLRGSISHWVNNHLIRQADALQVISPQLKEYIQSWRKPPKSIYTIFNGVDIDRYDCHQPIRSVRESLNLDENALVIGSVGRLDAIKGYDMLLRVFSVIAKRWKNAHLILVGDGPEREILETQVTQLKLETRVHFTGFCEDVRYALSAFDLYICSSLSEGVPMAILEAMAMGVPVVSTRVGGIESVIEEGRSGFLVPPKDEETLLNTLRELLIDRELLQAIGEEARKRVIDHFSLQRMIVDVQRMYDEVIKRITA